MPIFCIDVNIAFHEKLVPITHEISTSIGPDKQATTLELLVAGPENGPLREQEALSQC
jgi:hypothetical protein